MLVLFIFLLPKKLRNGRTNKMKLIEQEGQWWWINHKGTVLSPKFGTKARAEEWYDLHDNWLERPAIIR